MLNCALLRAIRHRTSIAVRQAGTGSPDATRRSTGRSGGGRPGRA